MKHIWKTGVFFLCLAAIPLFLTGGCGSWFKGAVEAGDTLDQPSLSSGDFPDVTPCSDRETLPGDATFISTLTDAVQVIHIYKEYTDDSKLPTVCGITGEDNTLEEGETGWDPSLGVNVYACNSFEETLSDFLPSTGYDPGICRSTFGYNKTDNSIEGFPRGGIYRVDTCISNDVTSYNVRLRITITGDDANKTWASVDIEEDTSLEVFNSAGFQLTTTENIKDAIVNDPEGTTFTIRSGGGTNTHLSVAVQVTCVKSTEFCPTPDYACD